jgi:hypothetical protein
VAGGLAMSFLALACNALTSVAVSGGTFAGATSDVHCDRRFVTDGGKAAPFCQEVRDTLAASQFSDDCRMTHEATAAAGLCPREHILAGCKLLKTYEDKSSVYDWYYDVRDIEAEAGTSFDDPPTTTSDVERLCADPGRYEDGAEFVNP